jgi:hypothetical protein
MDKFYESNLCLSSPVVNHSDFPDYTFEELVPIVKLILETKKLSHFANARSTRNALDRARTRQANLHYLFILYAQISIVFTLNEVGLLVN